MVDRRDGTGSEPDRKEADARPPLVSALLPAADTLKKHARVRAKQVVRSQVPGGARAAFRIDMTSMFLAGIYTGAVFPFVNIIARDDLKCSSQVLGLIIAAPFIGNLLAMFFARAMEGQRKMPFVKWSWFAARLTIALTLFATKAWPFALIICAAQLIGTVATPAYAAVIKDIYPDSQRGQILGLTRGAILLGQVSSTMFAGWLMSQLGKGSYREVFPIAALVGMAAALLFARIEALQQAAEPEAPDETPGEPPLAGGFGARLKDTALYIGSTFGILKEDGAFRWFALSVFTYGFGNLLTVPITTVIQVDELHVHKSEIAVLTILTQVVAIVGYFYWGRFVDRRGPQKAVVVNVLLNSLIPMVYILTGVFTGAGVWMLVPAFLISGVVGAGIDLSYFNAILTFSGTANVSRYQALQSFLLGVRGTIAPFIGSAAIDACRSRHVNLRWAFVVGMLFMLSGAWMQREATRRQEALQRLKDEG